VGHIKNCHIPQNEFINALKLILNSTFFTFDKLIYKQNFGTPIGSLLLSPIISDLVMRDLEERSLETLNFPMSFYVRYVDDIAMTILPSSVTEILRVFNGYHPRLQFTVEMGGDFLNFLDVIIIKNNNSIEFDWYHKPTFSGRFLNFLSQHPLSPKRGTIIGMVDRLFFLSQSRFHEKNLKFIIRILLENNYPIKFIFNTINRRIKYLLTRQFQRINSAAENKVFFTIPFLQTISNQFSHILKDPRTRLLFYSLKIYHIKVHKDVLPTQSQKNVVYKLACKDCDATYVGQTSRQLKTRIAEHSSHIRRNTNTHSVIIQHRIEETHEFDWENVKVLDRERFLSKRLISEMMHIRLQKNSLNLQSDTKFLNSGITSLLKKL